MEIETTDWDELSDRMVPGWLARWGECGPFEEEACLSVR